MGSNSHFGAILTIFGHRKGALSTRATLDPFSKTLLRGGSLLCGKLTLDSNMFRQNPLDYAVGAARNEVAFILMKPTC